MLQQIYSFLNRYILIPMDDPDDEYEDIKMVTFNIFGTEYIENENNVKDYGYGNSYLKAQNRQIRMGGTGTVKFKLSFIFEELLEDDSSVRSSIIEELLIKKIKY